jgi:uncharacterized protein
MFIGRDDELSILSELYQKKRANLVVIYGRRRVGKSTLIEQFMKNRPGLQFEGLEKVKKAEQIKQFTHDLSLQLNDPVLASANFSEWLSVFDYLTRYFKQQKKKTILFLDEFQWLANNQSALVSIVKKYWDKHWSKQKVMLILCGSISSYMVRSVVQSKALYGRINWELCLETMSPPEAWALLKEKRSQDEIFQYLLSLGGVPKYLNEIETNRSLEQNLNRLCFTKNGYLVSEYQKIFYSQFKAYKTYEAIIAYLNDAPRSLGDVAKKLNMASGGGLKLYLDNLKKAQMITEYVPFGKLSDQTNLKKYKLTDDYIRFYFKFIRPNLKIIAQNRHKDLFSKIVKPKWDAYLGFSFEAYCLKNAIRVADIMGFGDKVEDFGPLFKKGDSQFQIDLLYIRRDRVITLCEIKYHSKPISVGVVKSVERKCKLLDVPSGYTLERALITRFGADESLQELGYFDYVISALDFF